MQDMRQVLVSFFFIRLCLNSHLLPKNKSPLGVTLIKSRAQPGARAATPVKSKGKVVPQTHIPLSIKEVTHKGWRDEYNIIQ